MKIEELKQIVKGQMPAPNVFVLWGEEAFLKGHYKRQLLALLKPDVMEDLNYYQFEGKNYSLAQVDEAIEALPVLCDRKLLLFTDSLVFKPDARNGAKAEYREYWAKRLSDIPPEVYIIFDESEVDKRSALLKQADKTGACVEFSYMTDEEMVRWTVRLFENMGKSIGLSEARYLNEITESGMMAVRREAEKLVAYAGENPAITKEDIDVLVTPSVEGKVFDMVAAMLKKDSELALHLLEDLFRLKTDPNQILAALIYNSDKLLETKLLVMDGADKNQIISKLKISPFAATKFLRDCAKYSLEHLQHLVARLTETDGYLKSNSMEKEVLISLLVSEFSA